MVTSGGLALLDSEKAEALADSLQAQLQLVKDPSEPAVNEVVNEVMRAYALAPGSEHQLINPAKFKTLFGVSKSARHHVQIVYRIGP